MCACEVLWGGDDGGDGEHQRTFLCGMREGFEKEGIGNEWNGFLMHGGKWYSFLTHKGELHQLLMHERNLYQFLVHKGELHHFLMHKG